MALALRRGLRLGLLPLWPLVLGSRVRVGLGPRLRVGPRLGVVAVRRRPRRGRPPHAPPPLPRPGVGGARGGRDLPPRRRPRPRRLLVAHTHETRAPPAA